MSITNRSREPGKFDLAKSDLFTGRHDTIVLRTMLNSIVKSLGSIYNLGFGLFFGEYKAIVNYVCYGH